MTHRPEVEETVVHLIRVHGCDDARAMLDVTQKQAMIDAQNAGLAAFHADGSPQARVVSLTEVVADLLHERLDDLKALHIEHHEDETRLALLHDDRGSEVPSVKD